MKPLLRQYFYDKLRRSLFHHELKTKVWNNPYFPFLTKEDYDQEVHALSIGSKLNKLEIKNIFEGYQAEVKNKHVLSVEQYNNCIDNIVETMYSDELSLKDLFRYCAHVWEDINYKYDNGSLCSSYISNQKRFIE